MQARKLPYVTLGCRYDGQATQRFFDGEMDEVRFWQAFRSADAIRSDMFDPVNSESPNVAGYWTFDVDNETTMFNASPSAESAAHIHLPASVRSDIPGFRNRAASLEALPRRSSTHGITLKPFEYLQLARNPLPRFTDATYSFWFMGVPSDTAVYFSIVNLDHGFDVAGRRIRFSDHWYPYSAKTGDWNHLVFRSWKDGRGEVFVNGIRSVEATSPSEYSDRWYRFEGLFLGFSNDKYNRFSANSFEESHRALEMARSFRFLSVWDRALSDVEIAGLRYGTAPPNSRLKAYWPLNARPDVCGNLLDEKNGYLLHVKRVRAWEAGK